MRGLLRLTWLEIKIFLREPLGAIGAIVMPVVLFVVLGKIAGGGRTPTAEERGFVQNTLPVFAALMITLNAVLSLVTIIAIYREGGILKRLRATPLRPHTILTAHVVVKLLLSAVTLAALALAGKRYYPPDVDFPLAAFGLAMLIGFCSILSMGFVIASVVPTSRFAQPMGALILYPMIGLSGLFYPLANMPSAAQTVARFLPLTYVVSLLSGIQHGEPWSEHLGDIGVLVLVMVVFLAISSRVFRWE